MMLRRNVLIFHQAALGDFIVTWPLAMALSRVFPQSRIIYVTHSQKGALAERVLRVESVDAESGWHSLFSDTPRVPPQCAKLLEMAHTIVSFTAGSRDQLAQGVSRAASHCKIVSLDTKRDDDGHVAESILKQLGQWPMLHTAMEQMLHSVASRGVGYRVAPQDRVLVHPGAGKERSWWPADRYLHLIRTLRDEQNKNVRVLLGEAELEKWPVGLINDFEATCEVHRPTTLLELLEEITQAAAFIGNDSGPGHLAGILGVPTISLFGTDSTRWRPLGPRVTVIRSESISRIGPEDVYTGLTRLLGG